MAFLMDVDDFYEELFELFLFQIWLKLNIFSPSFLFTPCNWWKRISDKHLDIFNRFFLSVILFENI